MHWVPLMQEMTEWQKNTEKNRTTEQHWDSEVQSTARCLQHAQSLEQDWQHRPKPSPPPMHKTLPPIRWRGFVSQSSCTRKSSSAFNRCRLIGAFSSELSIWSIAKALAENLGDLSTFCWSWGHLQVLGSVSVCRGVSRSSAAELHCVWDQRQDSWLLKRGSADSWAPLW